MIKHGNDNAAIVICRENLYESNALNAARENLETALIGRTNLELSARRGHPNRQDRGVAFEQLGKYPCFSSIRASSSEMYVPYLLTKYGIELRSTIAMEPSTRRYRLPHKTNGYLTSLPLPAEIKEEYGLESVRIEDSSITVFAVFRKDPQKNALIQEYLEPCRALEGSV